MLLFRIIRAHCAEACSAALLGRGLGWASQEHGTDCFPRDDGQCHVRYVDGSHLACMCTEAPGAQHRGAPRPLHRVSPIPNIHVSRPFVTVHEPRLIAHKISSVFRLPQSFPNACFLLFQDAIWVFFPFKTQKQKGYFSARNKCKPIRTQSRLARRPKPWKAASAGWGSRWGRLFHRNQQAQPDHSQERSLRERALPRMHLLSGVGGQRAGAGRPPFWTGVLILTPTLSRHWNQTNKCLPWL